MDVVRLSANDLDRNASRPMVVTPQHDEPHLRVLASRDVPRGRWPSGTTLAMLAVLAGVGALSLGSWAFLSEARSDGQASTAEDPSAAMERAISLLSKPSTQRLPLTGSDGRIVLAVGIGGRAVLTLDELEPARADESYQAWLIGPDGRVTASAAVFMGTETIVPLSQIVPRGSGVGVTLERAGGVPAPTRTLTLVAERG
ncbi:MAG TPA: anti-sigma factor [Gaiellaceae bacterium]|nr:anti-sigma factor [Gaiellaceae bacterium]